MGLIVDKLLTRPFVEPGEPAFEGQFPSSRVALLARTGHLRNPPGVLQQHMPQHLQQQPPHPSQHPHPSQQPATLAPAPGQALYAQAPAAGASAFVYFPLQQLHTAPAPVLPVGIPHAQLALQMTAPGPPPHRMPAMSLPGPVPPPPAAATMAPPPPLPVPPPAHGGAPGPAGGHPSAQPNVGPRLEVSIEVPENRIGLLIGRGGETLQWMQRLMSVSIHIARRPAPAAGEGPAPPVSMRRVTISGARNAVNIAHAFILQRLSGSRGGGGGGGGGEAAARH